MSEEANLDEFVGGDNADSSEWMIRSLGELAEYQNGNAFSKSEWGDEGYPIIRIQNLTGEQDDFNYFDGDLEERYKVEAGDTLLSWSATIDVFQWSGPTAALNQHIFRVDSSDDVNDTFYRFKLEHLLPELVALSHGSTMQHVRKADLVNVDANIPPLPEQRKIATILYTVDQAIEKTEDVINRLNRVQKGTLRNLFRDGVGKQSETKTTPMGQFPKDWELKTMESVGSLINGNAFPKEYQGSSEGDYPFVKVSDTNDYRRYVSGAQNYIPQEIAEEIGCNIHPEGTVILPKRGAAIMTNKRRILAQDSAIDNNQIGIVGEKVKPLFLYYYLSDVDMGRFVQEGAVKSLTKSLLSKIRVPVPPIEIQSKIVTILESIDKEIEAEKRVKTHQERLKRGLMQDLLSGTVRTTDTNIQVPEEITKYG
ncbi:type I restriction enzyme, S subunit [Haloplanus vescus]|uniref:Type I restriction enzyme, S subunit n=1 Tax=Haloplanus vescus TaxID=555874 RepID=A0A1H3WDM0_9EURY|nr:restriction endonuclease subunit S [Haloplanus vescus]SDZ84338.1 type I restriction enzyme, S subunit [Haloplanus vescus]